jgi:TetR/AcrR family transcriptional regulator
MAWTVAELGYQDTTIRTVVGRARVSSTTFYDFFEDKEDCFLATAGQRIDRLLVLLATACERENDPAKRFGRGLDDFLQLCADEPDTAYLCVTALGTAGTAARARRAEMMEQVSELARAGLAGMRPNAAYPSPLTATIVVGGIHHLVQDRLAKGEVKDLPRLGPEILRLVVPAF